MKRILCVFGLIALLAMAQVAGASEVEPLRLSFADAVEFGLNNNLDLRLAALTLQEAAADLERARIVGDEDDIEAATERFEDAQKAFNDAEESLILDIEQRYVDLLRAIDRLEDQRASYQEAERRHAMEEARFQAGLISEVALKTSANSLRSAKQNLENQEQALQTQRYAFNELLGVDLHADVELTETIEVRFEPLQLTLEEAVDLALAHSENLLRARETLAEAQEQAALAQNEFTPRAEREKAINAVTRAEIALAKAEARAFMDTRSAYLTVQQREGAIAMREAELDIAKINLEIAKAQFAIETISEETLNDRVAAVKAAERAVIDAIWDHISARRALMRTVGQPESMRTALQ